MTSNRRICQNQERTHVRRCKVITEDTHDGGMSLKIGVDIVHIPRIKKGLNDDFISKVLSDGEASYFRGLPEQRALEFLAGRFAAKEAIIKCFDDGCESPVMFEIEILNDASGRPQVNYKDHTISVSISHENEYAVAMALLES